MPKLRLESPTAISLFSLRDGPLGYAEWSSSRASSKDSHQNKEKGGWWWCGEGQRALTRNVGTKRAKWAKQCCDDSTVACTYLDNGRWWSDSVVDAGCMVLCLATCVLIIAELGVCGCQKELLQLCAIPYRIAGSGKRERERSESGLFK